MYTLFRSLPLNRVLSEQAPAVGSAWLIAEFFFKFHSFTLECAAFLATWYLFEFFDQKIVRPFVSHRGRRDHGL